MSVLCPLQVDGCLAGFWLRPRLRYCLNLSVRVNNYVWPKQLCLTYVSSPSGTCVNQYRFSWKILLRSCWYFCYRILFCFMSIFENFCNNSLNFSPGVSAPAPDTSTLGPDLDSKVRLLLCYTEFRNAGVFSRRWLTMWPPRLLWWPRPLLPWPRLVGRWARQSGLAELSPP